jgi:uncharacterized protein YegL
MSVTYAENEDSGIMGGPMARRTGHFIWLLDCSGSMSVNGKIASLNTAIRDALPEMRTVARANPASQLLVRTVTFSNGARWHGSGATPVESFTWTDVSASERTDMGAAFRLVADEFQSGRMPTRAMRPVLALVSDGQPTDDWRAALRAIDGSDWGRKAVRVAIAIGSDADKGMMQEFLADPEQPVLEARNGKQLAAAIRWASTVAVATASIPRVQQDPPSRPSMPPPRSQAQQPVFNILDTDTF